MKTSDEVNFPVYVLAKDCGEVIAYPSLDGRNGSLSRRSIASLRACCGVSDTVSSIDRKNCRAGARPDRRGRLSLRGACLRGSVYVGRAKD